MKRGCLSVPDQHAEVVRFEQVRVRYRDYRGNACEVTADGCWRLRCKYEIDHLDGVLYIDRISRLKRQMLLKTAETAGRRTGIMKIVFMGTPEFALEALKNWRQSTRLLPFIPRNLKFPAAATSWSKRRFICGRKKTRLRSEPPHAAS